MTAIELLKQDIDLEIKSGTKMVVNWDMYLEMEKQQIIDAAERWKGTDFAEKYYAETYGSKDIEKSEKPINLTSSQTEISDEKPMRFHCVPKEISDEEIKKQANIHGYEEHSFFTAATSNQKRLSWIAACKWYREQLKSR